MLKRLIGSRCAERIAAEGIRPFHYFLRTTAVLSIQNISGLYDRFLGNRHFFYRLNMATGKINNVRFPKTKFVFL
jgi:hypothetical protein